MKGTYLLPSLNRPHLVQRFIDSYKKTKSNVPVWVLVDREDPRKAEYLALEYPDKITLTLTETRTMGDKVNEVKPLWIDFDYVGILNDDHVLVTEEWDQKVLKQINGANVVATNDGPSPDKPWNAPHRLCGAITFSGPVLRALGYMFPPGIKHLYSDEAWGFLFNHAKNAQFIMDVCVYHDHAYKDEKQRDDTYRAINGEGDFTVANPVGGLWESDRAAFQAWLNKDAAKDAQKVLDIQPKTGIMIATPSQDHQVSMSYAIGLADATTAMTVNNIYFELARVCGSSLLPHARNSLVDMFLKSRCQRLLMVDADQGWSKESIFRLMQSPRMIIGGITPHKRFPINFNFEPLDEDKHFFKDLVNKGMEEFQAFAAAKADKLGNIEVNHVGTGFVMIDRAVFDVVGTQVNEYIAFDNAKDVKHKEFFKMSGEKGHYKGEDWWFMELARANKIPIYINANVILTHLGAYEFRP